MKENLNRLYIKASGIGAMQLTFCVAYLLINIV